MNDTNKKGQGRPKIFTNRQRQPIYAEAEALMEFKKAARVLGISFNQFALLSMTQALKQMPKIQEPPTVAAVFGEIG